VIEPDDGVLSIGSGAPFATAAAKALLTHTELSTEEIVKAAMSITADICIFTNHNITLEVIDAGEDPEAQDDEDTTGGEST